MGLAVSLPAHSVGRCSHEGSPDPRGGEADCSCLGDRLEVTWQRAWIEGEVKNYSFPFIVLSFFLFFSLFCNQLTVRSYKENKRQSQTERHCKAHAFNHPAVRRI